MFTPRVRWILVAGCVVLAAVFWPISRISSSGLLAAALLWALGHWRYGTVRPALRAYRAGRLDEMARQLERTRRPDLLAPQPRIYYEYLSGVGAFERADYAAARRHFFFATIDRRYNKVRALAWTQLAEAEIAMDDFAAARASIAQARRIANAQIEARLQQLERTIGNRDLA